MVLTVHLPAYVMGANYFKCGNPLLRTTSAYLADAPTQAYIIMAGNVGVAVFGSLLVWRFYQIVAEEKENSDETNGEDRDDEENGEGGGEGGGEGAVKAPRSTMWVRAGWAAAWLAAALTLSLPTALYAVTTTIPSPESAFQKVLLSLVHYGAPIFVTLVNSLLVP